MTTLFHRIGSFCIDSLFPRFCFGCRKEGGFWCEACAARGPRWLQQTGCPFCAVGESNRTCWECRHGAYLDGVFAPLRYADSAVRTAITTWKFHGDPAAREVLTRWVAQAAAHIAWMEQPFAVTHVPLHASRARSRGFDQGQEVARMVAGNLGAQAVTLLRRRVRTQAQTGSISRRRVGEMDGAFEAVAPVPERVILCDDVFTSGATLEAAARALKEAGAQTVWGFTLAKA